MNANKVASLFRFPDVYNKREAPENIIPNAVFTFMLTLLGLKFDSMSKSNIQPSKATMLIATAVKMVITVMLVVLNKLFFLKGIVENFKN
jgi:multisubunit Na+/H+ antiporter MnhG subunit